MKRTQVTQAKERKLFAAKQFYGFKAKNIFKNQTNVFSFQRFLSPELNNLCFVYETLERVLATMFRTERNELIFEGILLDGSSIYFTASESIGIIFCEKPCYKEVVRYEVYSHNFEFGKKLFSSDVYENHYLEILSYIFQVGKQYERRFNLRKIVTTELYY